MRTISDSADEPRYLIRAVVRLTGIPAATLRSWERRHGFPSPGRTATARRVYSEGDVQAIHWMTAQLAQGISIGQAVQWYRSGHGGEVAIARERTGARPSPPDPFAFPDDNAPASLVRRILRAVTGYDEGELESVLSSAFSLHPVDVVLLEVMLPVLLEIGDQWAQGHLDVTAEHFASNAFHRRLFNLMGQQPAAGPGAPVVLACVPGEEHDLGLLMLAAFLRWAGVQPLFLGANVPIADLLRCLRQTRAWVLCLSAVNGDAAPALAETAKQVALADLQLIVFAGGRACGGVSLPPDVRIPDGDLREAAEAIASAVRPWTAREP